MPVKDIEPYVKSLDDELDWKLLEQLHKVVLQLSDTCFKIKQICVTAQIAVATLLVKFTDNNLDDSIFVAGLLIAFLFWFLDGVTFYYQVKIRGTMNGITERLKSRQPEKATILAADGSPLPEVIGSERADRSLPRRIRDSFFNHSMWLYWVLMGVASALWFAFRNSSIST